MFIRPVFNAKGVSLIRLARFCLGGKTHVFILLLNSNDNPVQIESQFWSRISNDEKFKSKWGNPTHQRPIRTAKTSSSSRIFPTITSRDKLHLRRIKELTIIGTTWWSRITSLVLPLEDAGCRSLYEGLPKVWTLLNTRAEPHLVFPVEKTPRGRPMARPPQNQQRPTGIKSLDFKARRRRL